MRRTYLFFGFCIFILFISAWVNAQRANPGQTGPEALMNRLITFSGTLKDAQGHPRLGIMGITFTLYASQEDGDPLWRESQAVQTDEQGRYTVLLGVTQKEGLPVGVFSDGKARWLGVEVQGEKEQPRVLLVAVPYALKAADADTVGGKSLSSFVLYEDLAKIQQKAALNTGTTTQSAIFVPGTGIASTAANGSTAGMSQGAPAAASGSGPGRFYGNETGSNTWYGEFAGAAGPISSGNSFFGYSAGYSDTSGGSNSFFGYSAGFSNLRGNGNSFFGYNAGYTNSSGTGNSFFGQNAGYLNIMGNSNAFFGDSTGYSNSGDTNSFFGYSAGYSNTSASSNSFFGSYAGYATTYQGNNSFFGTNAGRLSKTSSNSFFGYNAGYSNSSGNFNSFFGNLSGQANWLGSYNAFFGDRAGYSNTMGDGNSFFGYNAGYTNSSGTGNSFFGNSAGYFNSTQNMNSFFGDHSGYRNDSGAGNSFFGYNAGYSNSSGGGNAFFGNSAGYTNRYGSSNSFFGDHSGSANYNGSLNSFFGYNAGVSNTAEQANTFLGAQSNGIGGITNATAIGAQAQVTQSNSLVLGSISGVNGASTNTNVGIGTTAPKARLDVIGPIYSSAWGPLTGSGLALLYDQAGTGTGLLLSYDSVADHALDFAFRGLTIDLRSGYYGNTSALFVTSGGNIGIGTKTPSERLQVVGNLKVSGNIIYGAPEEPVPDYVFDSDYRLMPVEELQKYIQEQRHLPNVPNAGEIKEKGINLGDFQWKLLQKIEELTLYTVQQATTIREQDNSIRELRARLAALEKTR